MKRWQAAIERAERIRLEEVARREAIAEADKRARLEKEVAQYEASQAKWQQQENTKWYPYPPPSPGSCSD